jgi:hypothetical protein
MSVALSVAFTGLCALITGGHGAPGEVLLVDAKGVGEVRGVTLPEHSPTLVVGLRALANAETSDPTRVVTAWSAAPGSAGEPIGIWDLTGSEVRIRAAGASARGVEIFRASADDASWTGVPQNADDPDSWRDMRYVPTMESLVGDGRIDPRLVGGMDAPATDLPRTVAARVFFEGGRLEGGMPSPEFRNKVFEFNAAGLDKQVRQALTDTIRWILESDAEAVVIDITPIAGGRTKRLLLGSSASPHSVFISNLPTEMSSHAHADMTEDELGAAHFAAYYRLLKNDPSREPALLVAPEPRRGAGLIRGPFCPGARFTLP